MMTFAELKARLDALAPEQLSEPVRWWGDDRGGAIDDVLILDEDYVSFGEGMEPWSAYESDPDVSRSDALAALGKGTPIFLSDLPKRPGTAP